MIDHEIEPMYHRDLVRCPMCSRMTWINRNSRKVRKHRLKTGAVCTMSGKFPTKEMKMATESADQPSTSTTESDGSSSAGNTVFATETPEIEIIPEDNGYVEPRATLGGKGDGAPPEDPEGQNVGPDGDDN